MAVQFSRVTVEVTIGYDDETCSEHDAQQALLEHALCLGGTRGATIHHAEITRGLVDRDGVPA